jgi:hypothetical protein
VGEKYLSEKPSQAPFDVTGTDNLPGAAVCAGFGGL